MFIRHTDKAMEVDEETFFTSAETGGTLVSSALVEMKRIIAERYSPSDWNIYGAAGLRRRQFVERCRADPRAAAGGPAAALPVFRLSRGRRRERHPLRALEPGHHAVADLQDRAGGEPVRHAPGATSAATSIRCSATCSRRTRMRPAKAEHEPDANKALLFEGSDWNFDTIRRVHDAVAEIAERGPRARAPIRNQIEVITAEQMLDAYASTGMPLLYKHWSFGKQFAQQEAGYRKGYMGLAYEIVINSNPCISYIMEENSATMQTLVIAHAAFGHNHFFKNNYLFKQWTDADGILDYLDLRQALHHAMRGALRGERGRAPDRQRPRAAVARHPPLSPQEADRPQVGRAARAGTRTPSRAGLQRPVAHGARQGAGQRQGPVLEARRRAMLDLPQENILHFLEKSAPRLQALAARDPAHRPPDRAVFLSAAPDQGDERGLRHLLPLPDHDAAARDRADRRWRRSSSSCSRTRTSCASRPSRARATAASTPMRSAST